MIEYCKFSLMWQNATAEQQIHTQTAAVLTI